MIQQKVFALLRSLGTQRFHLVCLRCVVRLISQVFFFWVLIGLEKFKLISDRVYNVKTFFSFICIPKKYLITVLWM